jgi:uncharacterized protein
MLYSRMVVQKIQESDYLYLTWDEMGQICFNLAKKILSTNANYDRLVALAKGGWTMARAIADYLAIDKVASIQYGFYTDIATKEDSPTLKQSLPISVDGERLLVFDDVADSGGTLKAATTYLKNCGAASLSTATLFFKPQSKFKPNFYTEKTSAWIIFPHEIRESIEQLSEKWSATGMTNKEVKSNLLKIGLPKNQVNYFLTI